MSTSGDPFLDTASDGVSAIGSLHDQIEGSALRRFLAFCAMAIWAAAMVDALLPTGLDQMHQFVLIGDGAVVALLLCAVVASGSRWSQPPQRSATWSAWIVCAGLVVAAVAVGRGVHSMFLSGAALVTCMLTVLAGMRRGAWLTGACAVTVSALAAQEWSDKVQGPWAVVPALTYGGAPGESIGLALATHALFLGVGLGAGRFLSTVMQRALQAAFDREQRFRSIVRMAVDWHWEQDDSFRYTAIHAKPGDALPIAQDEWLHHAPWELPHLNIDEDTLDAHRADLESRRPFTDLAIRMRDPGGRWRYLSLSGEPRHDAAGVFRGYWGVGQDVTQRVSAKRATEASEHRYRQLFESSPSPVLLHRRGHIVDANQAAVRMFGSTGPAAIIGRELATLYAEGPSRSSLQDLVGQLERLPVGSAMPIAEFRMTAQNGRPLSVQATSVRVDGGQGSAIMTIYFDVTARVKTEAALRRSEGMLSLLFATSPDCITLTEMDSGRYRLVNDSFSRLTGYRSDEVVGRTGADLGLWDTPADLEALLSRLRRHGHVDELPAVFRSKRGDRISMLVSAARFAMGKHDYVVINARDVTEAERVRLEHAAIFQHASVGIALIRGDHFLHVNPRFERVFGWPIGSLTGLPCATVHADVASKEEIWSVATPLLEQALPFETEREMRRHDGSLFVCRMMAQVVDPAAPEGAGTIWIAEDVTSQHDTASALEAARDAAEAASRAKSAFLANTSHEIRTPLNGLLGMARLAMREGIGESSRRRHLQQIHESAQSLSDIISDILDLSKIEAGKLALETVPFNLHAALDALSRTYSPLAEAKGLSLHLNVDATVPRNVRGDPMRVRQVIGNFISNALKFTDRGSIRVQASTDGDGAVRVEVHDTGAGIDDTAQERLFAPFTQADDSTTRRYGGTGLGLSICRQLARMMGGEVGMQSTAGVGSMFWAVLPLAVCEPPNGDSPGGDGALPVQSIAGTHVLLVEDNPVNMLIASAMLEQWDVVVHQAADGRQAIDAVQRAEEEGNLFQLVLMDVQMPVMSGHQATRLLRQRYSSGELPIVALTAAALVSEREEALASGMNDFLTKPIDATRLFDTVARFRLNDRTTRPA